MGIDLDTVAPDRPVLIAGATASGKSALALEIARAQGGVIVNADALQVFAGWNVVTARPPASDLAQAPHQLYGHVPLDGSYSVGHWLRDVTAILETGVRPIIVGGTGLYFRALTEGLADIPATPSEVRNEANARRIADFKSMIPELDRASRTLIDLQNPMRVQRAWEVLKTTGKGLAAWQDETPPPLLSLDSCTALHLDAERDWLNQRIALRFDWMIDNGALSEAAEIEPFWSPEAASSKAIGAPELIAYTRREITLDAARDAAVTATCQYAKRQRTWFRARMQPWRVVGIP